MKRLAVLFLAATLPALAAADQRAYAFTYQPRTAPRGALDVELYATFTDPAGAAPGERSWRHQVELEYGITDRWDVSLYNVFRRPYGGELEYEAFKVRSRYRLTEPGVSVIDAVAYLEVQQSVVDERATKIEEKLLLARRLCERGAGFVTVAFTVVVLGGMGSFAGALVGGLLIGVVESLCGLLLGESLGQIGIFVIFIAVLLFKPQGLFGARA